MCLHCWRTEWLLMRIGLTCYFCGEKNEGMLYFDCVVVLHTFTCVFDLNDWLIDWLIPVLHVPSWQIFQIILKHVLKWWVLMDRRSHGSVVPGFLVRSAHFVHSIDSKSQTSFKKFLVDLLWTCQKDYCHRRLIWNLLLTNLVDFKSFRHTPLTIWERSNAFVENIYSRFDNNRVDSFQDLKGFSIKDSFNASQ